MARADDDSWDLASSVGATATMVAAGRAVVSRDPGGLINDPFAAPLVRAVGIDFFTKIADGELDLSDLDPESAPRVQANIDEMAVRTKFFDDYFETATAGGVRQAVILASGLDARAYRLAWPAGTVVYEIDQPDVIEFKTRTLDGTGAEPTAERRTVAIDLRHDWPTVLRDAGLDPKAPTAWCAEGLLIYLPPPAQDLLFDRIHALSAPGSTVATEYVPALRDFDPDKARAATAVFQQHGLDLDMPSLIYHGERHHPGEYLARHGWRMDGVARSELFRRYGRTAPEPDPDNPLGEIVYISGRLD
ncbi:class I SAM-dependent methyltransferase [Mycolicibacterium thermoresistibile]